MRSILIELKRALRAPLQATSPWMENGALSDGRGEPSPAKWSTPYRSMALLAVVLVCCACSPAPRIYTMNPSALERMRSDLSTVGVDLSSERPATEVLLPAKGVLGGVKRGFVVGATMPVMVGLVSPVPGGMALGVLAAPFGAVAGGIHGAFTALPADIVEDAQRTLEMAVEGFRGNDHRLMLEGLLIEYGNRHTAITFVPWMTARCAIDGSGERPGAPLPDAVDARLEVTAEKAGLRGRYRIDPPTEVFLQLRVRLVRTSDGAVLLDERVSCASEKERLFKEWASRNGARMIEEFESCLSELAEKIVDDCFRVYPLQWKRN